MDSFLNPGTVLGLVALALIFFAFSSGKGRLGSILAALVGLVVVALMLQSTTVQNLASGAGGLFSDFVTSLRKN